MASNKRSSSLHSLILKRSKLKSPNVQPKSEVKDVQVSYLDFSNYSHFTYKLMSSGDSTLITPSNKWKNSYKWTETLSKLNNEVFNHQSFKGLQEEIMNAVLSGEDALVIMPTGAGKSLTYQLTGIVTRGLTIVVQPLLSLIKDQMIKMRTARIYALELNSSQTMNIQNSVYEELENNPEVKFLFVTPETLAKSDRLAKVLEKLYNNQWIARLVCDEAHCIVQWGRDFRPDYLKLKTFRIKYKDIPMLALTASGTKEMQKEISYLLGLRSPILFSAGFNRQNLNYVVRDKTQHINMDIGNFIQMNHMHNSGIIYCNFIKDCEFLARVLKHNYKISCAHYHSEMAPEMKTLIHEKWLSGEIKVVVATSAFALGIDKKDVRFVIHYSLTESLELYYQETGRAGRDEVISDCILYYKYEDKGKLESLTNSRTQDIHKILEYCETVNMCRRKIILDYFGEDFDPHQCGKMCDNCKFKKEYVEIDVTPFVKTFLADIKDLRGASRTMLQYSEILRGFKSRSDALRMSSKCFGILKDWNKKNTERLLRMLVFKKIIGEERVKLLNNGGYYKIVPGQEFNRFLYQNITLTMAFRSDMHNIPSLHEENEEDDLSEIKDQIENFEETKILSTPNDNLDDGILIDLYSELSNKKSFDAITPNQPIIKICNNQREDKKNINNGSCDAQNIMVKAMNNNSGNEGLKPEGNKKSYKFSVDFNDILGSTSILKRKLPVEGIKSKEIKK